MHSLFVMLVLHAVRRLNLCLLLLNLDPVCGKYGAARLRVGFHHRLAGIVVSVLENFLEECGLLTIIGLPRILPPTLPEKAYRRRLSPPLPSPLLPRSD